MPQTREFADDLACRVRNVLDNDAAIVRFAWAMLPTGGWEEFVEQYAQQVYRHDGESVGVFLDGSCYYAKKNAGGREYESLDDLLRANLSTDSKLYWLIVADMQEINI